MIFMVLECFGVLFFICSLYFSVSEYSFFPDGSLYFLILALGFGDFFWMLVWWWV